MVVTAGNGTTVDDIADIEEVVPSVEEVALAGADSVTPHAPHAAANRISPAINTLDMMQPTMTRIVSA
ncbi:MAG: hypothetical protein U9R51_04760 [Actinomycetota bacterium]|nr:hypothetical protein [Actinomycetota bacterium]